MKNRKKTVLAALCLCAALLFTACANSNKYDKEKYAVGNYITFGTYPQTAVGMDETPIEWLVLDRDGDKALLISRYGLDAQYYNDGWTDITWEKCALRTWLNSTFMNKAFTSDEQKGIALTNVDNSKNQGYGDWSTDGGSNTQDKIFLLSYTEANKYFGVTYNNSLNVKACVEPTAYAIAHGAFTNSNYKTADGKTAGIWWLRSPGGFRCTAACVFPIGSLNCSGVSYADFCVRPALWVNLNSGIF